MIFWTRLDADYPLGIIQRECAEQPIQNVGGSDDSLNRRTVEEASIDEILSYLFVESLRVFHLCQLSICATAVLSRLHIVIEVRADYQYTDSQ